MPARTERLPNKNMHQGPPVRSRQVGPGVSRTITVTVDLAFLSQAAGTLTVSTIMGEWRGNGMVSRRIVMIAAGTTATIPYTDCNGHPDGVNGSGMLGVQHEGQFWKIRPMGTPANGPTFIIYE